MHVPRDAGMHVLRDAGMHVLRDAMRDRDARDGMRDALRDGLGDVGRDAMRNIPEMLGEMQCAMLGAIPEMRGVMFGMHETSGTRAGTRGERGIETHEVCTTLETHVELVCRTSARAPSAFWGFRAICSWTICTGRH